MIRKSAGDLRVPPHLADYAAERAGFSWAAARRELAGLPDGGLNIAYEAVTRHAAGPLRDHIAFRFLAEGSPRTEDSRSAEDSARTEDSRSAEDFRSAEGSRREVTYGELDRLSNRFTNVLRTLGVGRDDRMFVLTGRIPELYLAVLGALKNGTAVSPLFSAFGPGPIATRITLGKGAVLVTTAETYRRKVATVRGSLPTLRHVLIVGGPGEAAELPGTLDLATLMAEASDVCEIAPTGPEDVALLHFTSGTTGTPKGAVHVHDAAVTHWATGKYALDLHPDDIYWCTADPGWVTGTSYGIIAPLLHGVTSIVDAAEFDAERWYRILEEERVTVWYTAPTAVRMLMRAGPELAARHTFPSLRFVASVGEPLNPEAVWWGADVLGLPIHDNWWQTETGGIMIANTPAQDIKPGSMGRPLPGVDAAIVERLDDGGVRLCEAADVEGELALRSGWPSMLRGYLDDEPRYRACFAGEWYLSGDLARRDADGYYWFVGRRDDVIKSAGHLIGPFEVESVLMEHPAVAEAAVIGKPDPLVGEVVKAFVSLMAGRTPDDALRREIAALARRRLGAAVAPKEIEFIDALPRTRSGKILRRLLKARELGLPEGDTSTLESGGGS
ncbi:acetate--CoA ligase [Raineyella sp.]|nr:acetate--CoA ligase [Raineyella sp.]MEA5153468.1 acetate--CoA ligase [Raineyella sp.]